eukprot:2342772-Rhodomonas_salina.1
MPLQMETLDEGIWLCRMHRPWLPLPLPVPVLVLRPASHIPAESKLRLDAPVKPKHDASRSYSVKTCQHLQGVGNPDCD